MVARLPSAALTQILELQPRALDQPELLHERLALWLIMRYAHAHVSILTVQSTMS